ncbi:hypothetical protein [Paenibacillus sp. FSL H7-0331]|uniref:hypothetical protein n=1 Tax=Paenibacillus sp. FSL H7-0331 TaxID=1920421 RepID=UPI00096E9038|nr:hypothetical protein [Paenibacillus sp. FSL H7-0331]OMF13102.1 hypothetical protein BK127_21145 [Paenibacillus sp. FSL H7-0331]
MILELLGKQYEFANEVNQIPNLLQTVEISLANSGLYVLNYQVDDQEVIGSLEEYIESHIESIDRVQVVTASISELHSSLVTEGSEYLLRATPSMNRLADLFYQGPGKEAWAELEHLLEAFEWLDSVLRSLRTVYTTEQILDELKRELEDKLGDFQEALINQDSVLIADMIVHEFIPLFDRLQVYLDSKKNEVEI